MKLPTLFVAGTILALSAAAVAQVPARSAERISREVRHELLMLPYLGVFDNVSYKVDGYNVTLIGQVTRPTLKSDAELSHEELSLLLGGIDLAKTKHKRWYRKASPEGHSAA